MEQLLLRFGLALQELYVVDQQHVGRTVAILEAVAGLVLDRLDELVGEGLDRDVDHFQVAVLLVDVVADGLQQMGLSQSYAAVDQARVVGPSGVLGDRHSRAEGELVAVTFDKAGEAVVGVELGMRRPFGAGDGALDLGWRDLGLGRERDRGGAVGPPNLEGDSQVLSGEVEQRFFELRSIPLVDLVPVERRRDIQSNL